MKKTGILFCSLTAAATMNAAITTVSINFNRDNAAPNLIAPATAVGAPVDNGSAADNWNNITSPSGTPTSFSEGFGGAAWIDSDGDATPSGFTFDIDGTNGIGNAGSAPAEQLQWNGVRFDGYGDFVDGDSVFSLNNTAALFSGTFDLYVYAGSRRTRNAAPTVFMREDANESNVQSFIFAINDANGTFVEGTDYLLFPGLVASSNPIVFDIYSDGSNQDHGAIGGFQLVGEEAVVPESSAFALLAGVATLGLTLSWRRR